MMGGSRGRLCLSRSQMMQRTRTLGWSRSAGRDLLRICPGPLASGILRVVFVVLIASAGSISYSQTAAANESDSLSLEKALARAQSSVLERHYSEAIKILRTALRDHPGEAVLQLELGRAYLVTGKDDKAQRLFHTILTKEPENRGAQIELARTFAYQGRYGQSDGLYRHLLGADPADEAAAIGLTSNLMHQGRRGEAAEIASAALRFHPASLRLLEYKDRIASGGLGGEERALPPPTNVFSATADYINDSGGNHSWIGTQRLELKVRPGITNDLHLEQQFLHSLDDAREVVETFSERIRWRPVERLAFSAGGGAVRFGDGDVRAIYEATLTGQLATHILAGAGFSRI